MVDGRKQANCVQARLNKSPVNIKHGHMSGKAYGVIPASRVGVLLRKMTPPSENTAKYLFCGNRVSTFVVPGIDKLQELPHTGL